MKNILFILFLFLVQFVFGQTVTTSPAIPILTEEITVVFDATGTPLENYSGTIYVHTGITSNGNDWQNVKGEWNDNNVQPSLANTSGNLYEFTIAPNVFEFYGATNSDAITKLSFVFRSADGNTKSCRDY